MLVKKRSKKPDEVIQVWVPMKKMKRPFPLIWGILSLGLFFGFAVATQMQFNRISDHKIYEARLDTYRSDERAYDTAVKAHYDCIASIETRETYRGIFTGIGTLFQEYAALPGQLFPLSLEAQEYQEQLNTQIEQRITNPLAENLPPKKPEDCPPLPTEKPERPQE